MGDLLLFFLFIYQYFLKVTKSSRIFFMGADTTEHFISILELFKTEDRLEKFRNKIIRLDFLWRYL